MENNGIQSDSNYYTAELGQENTFYAHRDTSVSHSNDFKNTFLLSEKWSSVVLWWKKNNPVPSKDLVRNKIKGSHGTFFHGGLLLDLTSVMLPFLFMTWTVLNQSAP